MMRKPGSVRTLLALVVFGLLWSIPAPVQAQGRPGSGRQPGGGDGPDPPRTRKLNNEYRENSAPDPNAPMVVAIEVMGNRQISRDTVLGLIQTREGRAYDQMLVQADVAKLNASSRFLDVKGSFYDRPGEGRVVRFTVIERAVIQKVQFIGNSALSEDKLVEVTGLRPGASMDPGLNKRMAQEIERQYHEKGYPFVEVLMVEGGRRDDVNVVIRISEGPKTKISSIRFEGAQFVSNARLKTQLASGTFIGVGKVGLGGEFDARSLEEDVVKLKNYYKAHGFLDVKVAPAVQNFNADRSRVALTYVIDEGPRYTISGVKLAGVSKIPEGDLNKKIELVDGKFYDELAVKKAAQEIRDTYGKNGYVNAEVQADLRYSDKPGQVDVVYQIREDQPRYLQSVRIEGNQHTKNNVIIKIADLEPGTLLNTVKLREAQGKLIESRLFQADGQVVPTVEIDPMSNGSDVLINVREAATGSLMVGAGVNSDAGVGGSIVLRERNFDLFRFPTSFKDIWDGNAFRGAGQEISLEAVPGTQVSRYSVTFLEPRLLGSDYSLQTSGYYYQRLFTNYLEERTGGRFTLGRRIDRNWGVNLGMRVETVGVSDPATPTPPDLANVLGQHFLWGPRIGVTHDTRDSQLNPSKGHFIEASYEYTMGDYDFSRIDLSGRQFFTIWSRRDGSGKHVLSLRGEVGWVDDGTPMFERWFIGGFQTLRGFEFRGVGPSVFDQKVGGDFMVLTSAEYYLPLTADDNLGWVFFCDAGTVESKVQLNNYRVAAGFGLRVKVPGMGPVPLAFDFGFPIVKTETDDTQLFSFSIGIFR